MAAPAIGARKRWTPPLATQLDWSHPLTAGLVSYAVPAGGGFYDVVRRATPTYTTTGSTPGIGSTEFGVGAGNAVLSGGTGHWAWPDYDWVPIADISIVVVHRKIDDTARNSSVIGGATGASGWGVALPWQDGTIYFDYGNTASNFRVSSAGYGASNFRRSNVWVFTAGLSGQAIWVNGSRLASNANAASRTLGTTPMRICGNANGWSYDTQLLNMTAIYNRILSANEIAMLYADPFCMFRH